MRRLLEHIALWLRQPGPVPVLPATPVPVRGASRDRHRPGKARIRARRAP